MLMNYQKKFINTIKNNIYYIYIYYVLKNKRMER